MDLCKMASKSLGLSGIMAWCAWETGLLFLVFVVVAAAAVERSYLPYRTQNINIIDYKILASQNDVRPK